MTTTNKRKLTANAARSATKRRDSIIGIAAAAAVLITGIFLASSFAGSSARLIKVGSTCLSASGGSISLATCKNSDKNQQWTLSTGGKTTIKSVGKNACIDVSARKSSTPTKLTSCDSTDSQKWFWNGNHINHGLTKWADKYCLGTVGGSTAAGAGVRIYHCTSSYAKNFSTTTVSGSSSSASTPPTSTSIATLAKQILASKLRIADYSENKSRDKAERSLASQQLADIANGKAAQMSSRCSYSSQLPGSVQPDIRILQFLADLGKESGFTLNVLFGQCHGAGSYHHKGKAADFECQYAGFDVAKADRIGAKYGVRRNGETCAKNDHWHYSVGGN